MLYKLKEADEKTTFVPVTPTTMSAQGLLEKKMEQWLADNPHAVLPEDEARVLVLTQEKAFQNLTDILAVDAEGNLVVIEVKRGQTPRDVIAQALEYASAVSSWDYQKLNLTATEYFASRKLPYESLLGAFQELFEVDPSDFDESKFNQRQRIFIVGEEIDQKIEGTVRWLLRQGVEITCVSYTCYRTDEGDIFLDFEETVRRGEAPPVTSGPKKPVGEDEFVQKMPPMAQAIYVKIKEHVDQWPGFQSGANLDHLKFAAGKNFAEIHPRKSGLRFHVRLKGVDILEKQSAMVDGIEVTRVPDGYGWSLNYTFTADGSTDLDTVERLLRQSYNAVRGSSV